MYWNESYSTNAWIPLLQCYNKNGQYTTYYTCLENLRTKVLTASVAKSHLHGTIQAYAIRDEWKTFLSCNEYVHTTFLHFFVVLQQFLNLVWTPIEMSQSETSNMRFCDHYLNTMVLQRVQNDKDIIRSCYLRPWKQIIMPGTFNYNFQEYAMFDRMWGCSWNKAHFALHAQTCVRILRQILSQYCDNSLSAFYYLFWMIWPVL